MKKEIALKAVSAYLTDKAKAEKSRTGIFWLNPVFAAAYDGYYKTVVDGIEYRIALTGINGFPPDGYIVCTDNDSMTIK